MNILKTGSWRNEITCGIHNTAAAEYNVQCHLQKKAGRVELD
ncbi:MULTISPECIES: hypothetical protein [Bacillus]